MKSKRLLIAGVVFFLMGLGSLWLGWNGSAGVNVSYPIAGTSVQLSGSAKGASALLGLMGLIFGMVVLLVAIVWTAVSRDTH